MKIKTEIKIIVLRESARVWEWRVAYDGESIGAGYCATKADALNDAGIFVCTLGRGIARN